MIQTLVATLSGIRIHNQTNNQTYGRSLTEVMGEFKGLKKIHLAKKFLEDILVLKSDDLFIFLDLLQQPVWWTIFGDRQWVPSAILLGENE